MHRSEVGAEEEPYLLGDGGEDLVPGRLSRDEDRHSPQRSLLVGQPFQSSA